MTTSPNRSSPRELTIRARNLLSRTMNLGTVSEERRSVESYKFNGWETGHQQPFVDRP
ncbi:aerobic respiration control protein ArcA [Escherichia coli]|uniref:Aerobic respiration control protein ArcA n=1 Tax=Escherichia coli TaxID=562 RepID=A0A377DXQ1_ECOLX|nr:aerobic respiration control protein ArcA [Escherichia coli]